MKRVLLIAIAVAAGFFWQRTQYSTPALLPDGRAAGAQVGAAAGAGNGLLETAIAARSDGVPVQGSGTVLKILPDDSEGSPHQRFIVRLPSGNTVLIAHNIQLAGRVSPLAQGDQVEFSGEYAWNPKGGVVHWTHHDPAGRHAAGWIRHGGQTVQ